MTATLTEQRRQVLQMLAEGKITTDEAEQLLEALKPEAPPSLPPGAHSAKKEWTGPSCLRVVVESADRFGGEGPSKVNVRVPLKLLRAGVKLASVLPPWAVDYANAALTKKGLNFD